MRYSIEPKDRIYVEGYGFLSFAKNIGKNWSNKYGQKLFGSAKKPAADAINTASEKVIQKSAEAIGDKIPDKSISKTLSTEQSSKELHSKNFENDNANNETEVPKERYIFPEIRQKIIDELRLL